jgi:hypothetical protein
MSDAPKMVPEPYVHVLHDIDVEQALLGAMMSDAGALDRARTVISQEHFFDPLHGRIFETADRLAGSGKKVIPLTVHAAMKSDPGVIETGGHAYFEAMRAAARALPNVEEYAEILIDLSLRRRLAAIGDQARTPPNEKTTAQLINEAQVTMGDLAKLARNSKGGRSISATPFTWTDPAFIPRREWLFNRHYIRKFVSATIGPGGLGKSFMGVVEDLAMVTGRPLMGAAPDRPLRVWSWNLEDPQEEHDRRYMAACLHYGISEADIGGRLFRDSGRDQPCIIAQSDRTGSFIVEPMVEEIIAALLERKIDVLRIDPYVSCHGVPENDNGAQDMVVKKWGVVAERANCSIELVDHTRKLGDRQATADDSRGASSKVAGCRAVRVLNRMDEVEAGRAGVDEPLAYFKVSNGKVNLVPMSKRADWFKLESIDLGNGPPADHVGVVVAWEWPDAFDGIAPGTLFAVQKGIAAGDWRENPQAKQWAGNAVAEVLHLDVSDKAVKARCRTLLHSWISGGALLVVSKPDGSRKERNFIEVGQWVEE